MLLHQLFGMRRAHANSQCSNDARPLRHTLSRRLAFESLEPRLAPATVGVVESFPTMFGDRTENGDSNLGISVAIDGEWAVAGAQLDAESGDRGGSAHVYRKVGTEWRPYVELFGHDTRLGDSFGSSVAVDGATIVVGAPYEDTNGNDVGAAYVFRLVGDIWTESAKLVASVPGRWFGYSLAIDGNTIVVGAPGEGDYPTYTIPSVSVFERSGENWIETATLSDFFYKRAFGLAVDVESDRIVVGTGTTTYDYGYERGVVFVYERNNSSWTLATKLESTTTTDGGSFGSAVAIEESTIFVGSPWARHTGDGREGAVYVYQLNGTQWVMRQSIHTSNVESYRYFGTSLDVDNGTLVVGGRGHYDRTAGRAYLLHKNVAGEWFEVDQFEATDSQIWNSFGRSIAVDGNDVLVGAYWRNADYKSISAVHRFEIATFETEVSLFGMQHLRSDRVSLDYAVQGSAPALKLQVFRSADETFDAGDLSHLVTSDVGNASQGRHVFEFNPGLMDSARPYLVAVATTTQLEHRLWDNSTSLPQAVTRYAHEIYPTLTTGIGSSNGGDAYGTVLAVDGNRAVVSAPHERFDATKDGAVYVLEKVDGHWIRKARLVPADSREFQLFGSAVAIDGDTIVIGATGDGTNGSNAGAAYVFELVDGEWIQRTKLFPVGVPTGTRFGFSVAIDGDTIVIGTRGPVEGIISSGSVYVFERVTGSWVAKSTLREPSSQFWFGYSVAIECDLIVIGDSRGADGAQWATGAVSLYQLQGGEWLLKSRVTSPENGVDFHPQLGITAFGAAVAIDGNRIAVAAKETNGGFAGVAYVYRIENGQLLFETRLATSARDATVEFSPQSIAIDGNFVVLGDSTEIELGASVGAAFLFELVADGTWVEHPKVLAINGKRADNFGTAVAIDNGELLIGAPGDDGAGGNAGRVHAFALATIDADVQLADLRLKAAVQAELDYVIEGTVSQFGLAVYRSADANFDVGDLAYVVTSQTVNVSGAVGTLKFDPGKYDPARPYLIATATSNLVENTYVNNQAVLQRLAPVFAVEQFPTLLAQGLDLTASELYGYDIDIDGDWAVVGAPQEYGSAFGTGSAYVLNRVDGQWVQQAKLSVTIGARYGFGASVAIAANTIVVGAAGPKGDRDNGGSAFVFVRNGDVWQLQQELKSSDARPEDGFGINVAIDGGAIVVAASAAGINTFDEQESVYLFERLEGTWAEVASFDGPDVNYHYSYFGRQLSLDGDTLAVSVPSYNSEGIVYLYERSGGNWVQSISLAAPAPNQTHGFGLSVDIDGDTMAIASTAAEVFIYERRLEGWRFRALVSASDPPLGGFGISIDLDRSFLAVGVNHDPYGVASDYSAVVLFARDALGNWREQPQPVHIGIKSEDRFGYAIALDGDQLLIGAPRRDDPALDAGAVFAYELANEADIDVFHIEQLAVDQVELRYAAHGLSGSAQLIVVRSTDATLDAMDFSYEVARELIASTSGQHTFLFDPGERDVARPYLIAVAIASEAEQSSSNNELVLRQWGPLGTEIVPSLPSLFDPLNGNINEFGNAIDVDGDWAVVGAYLDSQGGANKGAVYALRRDANGHWVRQAKIIAPAAAGTFFGFSVAISGNAIVVGAYRDDQKATDTGAAYVFRFNGTMWVQEAKLLGERADDFFGYSVAIDNDTIVVGAYGRDGSYATQSGTAYVYEFVAGTWAKAVAPTYYSNISDSDHQLGKSVAIDGDYIAIGGPVLNISNVHGSGGAVILARSSSGWTHVQTVWAPDAGFKAAGSDVALERGVLVLGAPEDNRSGSITRSGAAYVYELKDGIWTFCQKLVNPVAKTLDRFGTSVEIAGNTIAVQGLDGDTPDVSSATIRLYQRRSDGQWIRETNVDDSEMEANQYLYGPIAIDGTTLMVGGFSGELTGSGWRYLTNVLDAVYVFKVQAPAAPELPGDYTRDGAVDSADYTVWRNSQGRSVLNYQGADGNGDGVIDIVDYRLWKTHFGQTSAPVREDVGRGAAAFNLPIAPARVEQLDSLVAARGSAFAALEPISLLRFNSDSDLRRFSRDSVPCINWYSPESDLALLLALSSSRESTPPQERDITISAQPKHDDSGLLDDGWSNWRANGAILNRTCRVAAKLK